MPLTGRRLLIVAGKGGVGRSTIAVALALQAAREGRRTLVVELDGRGDVAQMLGGEAQPGLEEVELGSNLYHVAIDRRAVLEDYLRHEVRGPFPAGRLAGSRTFQIFVDATPGMAELLAVGKVWELARPRRAGRGPRSYDLVILDGPASGQLVALLSAPQTFRSLARVGPIARQTRNIESLLRNPRRTAILAVTTPEQMAVSETIALQAELADTLDRGLDAVCVNKMLSVSFSAKDEAALRGIRTDPAVAAARWVAERGQAQREEFDRLTRELPDLPALTLPLLTEQLNLNGLERLAEELEAA